MTVNIFPLLGDSLLIILAGFSLAAAMRPRDARVPRLYREP